MGIFTVIYTLLAEEGTNSVSVFSNLGKLWQVGVEKQIIAFCILVYG